MKQVTGMVLAILLVLSALLAGCQNNTNQTAVVSGVDSSYLAEWTPQFGTGTSFDEMALQNPLDTAFAREADAISDNSPALLDLLSRYRDYWYEEMQNAYQLALENAVTEEQSRLLQNEQESWGLYALDQDELLPAVTGITQGDESRENVTNARIRLNLYRTRALSLYEYYYIFASSASSGDVKIAFLFQDDGA